MNAPKKDAADPQKYGRAPAGAGQKRVRRRRSKPVPGVAVIIESLLAEKVTRSDGSRSGFTSLQAIVLHLLSKSAAGDKRATKVLMRYRCRDFEAKALAIKVIGGLPD